MRGGLSTIDRDYGIFNKIHHDIGTHVVHHLFHQIPHYNLEEATEVCHLAHTHECQLDRTSSHASQRIVTSCSIFS